MSRQNWESIHSSHHFPYVDSVDGDALPTSARVQSSDTAIDAALRSVRLPDGLLTRLDMLVLTMTDESTDQVDWLGC